MKVLRQQSGLVIVLMFWSIVGCGYLITLLGTCQPLDTFLGLSGCKVVTDIRGSELAYSDSGEKFYVLSDGAVEIWDAQKLELVSQISQWHVRWASISPDELMFLSSNGKELILWDLLNGQQLDSLPVEAGRIDFLTDDTIVVNNHADVTTQLWDLPAQDVYDEIPQFFHRTISLNKQIVAGSKYTYIEVWDIESNLLKRRVEVGNSPNSLALSSDGKFLAYASEKQDSNNKEVIEVILVDVETGETITKFYGFSKSVYALAFDPSDTILAAGSVDGSVHFWELDNEYRLTRLKFNNRERVWSIAFSPTRDEVLIGADHFTAVFPLSDILGR